MKSKSKRNSTWKATKKIISRNTPILLLFVLIHSLLFSFLIEPAGRFLWTTALRFSPIEYLTLDNLWQLLISPLVVLVILIDVVGLACWTYFNIAAIVICIHNSMENRPITLRRLLRESMYSMFRALKPRNLPVLVFSALIIPATHTIMTTNFISSLSIPEYIGEVIHSNPVLLFLLYAVTAFGVFLTVQYMFLFQYFILDNCSFVEAAGKSRRLIKGRRIRDFWRLICWNVRLHLAYFLYALALISLLIMAIAVFFKAKGSILVAGTLVGEYILVPLLDFFIECVETFSQYTFIAILYYEHLAEEAAGAVPAGSTNAAVVPVHAGSTNGAVKPVSADGTNGAGTISAENVANVSGENGSPAAAMAVAAGEKLKWRFRLFMPAIFLCILVFCCGLSWGGGYLIDHTTVLDAFIDQGPEVTSHRGYSAVAPENTLPSIQAAIDCGVAYAEIDVQQTSDGVVVLTHDTNLKRCTGCNVDVYDISWEELEKLDAGSWFSDEFVGTRVPSLEEVIKLAKGKIKLNIEIKNNGHSPELEAETVRLIRDLDFEDECVVTSISYDSLKKVKEIAPEIKTGYILAMGVGNYYDLPDADFFSVETTFINRKMVESIHERGKQVHAWTVDVEKDSERMISLGVDNIITGDPPMVEAQINADRDLVMDLLQSTDGWENVRGYFSESVYDRLSELNQSSDAEAETDARDMEELLNGA